MHIIRTLPLLSAFIAAAFQPYHTDTALPPQGGSVTEMYLMDEPDLASLPHIKSVTEWVYEADTLQPDRITGKKSLYSRRTYYPNGILGERSHFGDDGKPGITERCELGPDSLPLKELVCLPDFDKCSLSALYHYRPGEKKPYRATDETDMETLFRYNAAGKPIEIRQVENGSTYLWKQIGYDSLGLPTGVTRYSLLGNKTQETGQQLFEYQRDASGNPLRMDVYLMPNPLGDERARSIQTKTRTQTMYYNRRGERTHRIYYSPDGRALHLYTYRYEYYRP